MLSTIEGMDRDYRGTYLDWGEVRKDFPGQVMSEV